MKPLLTLFMLILSISVLSQTTSPIIEDFNSTDQPGEWMSVTGQPNTGAHVGQLCYNVTGNYLDNQYYSYESQPYDLTNWNSVDVIFSLTQSTRNGDQLALYYFDSATQSWSGWDLSGVSGTYTVTAPTTATIFSFDFNTNTNGNVNGKYVHIDYIYILDPSSPLPVELIYFTGETQDDANVFNWSTASEYNSDYFEIEWSSDAYEWTILGTTPAAGNSTINLYYALIEPCPKPIINYYRLVQYDWDGEFKIYDPIAIDNRKREKRILRYVSLSGQEIDPTSTTGLVLGILADGTSIKVYL